MRNTANALTVLRAAITAPACAHAPTPEARGADVERVQCSNPKMPQDELRVLQETTVIKAEPITFYVGAGVRTEGGQRVGGAKLLVRAPNGIPADDMTRILQCHSARALLGRVAPAIASADDPYFLPDTWVNINVKADRGFWP